MFDFTLRDDDKNWLELNYPSLKISTQNNVAMEIAGTLFFSMAFIEESNSYVINPESGFSRGVTIQDRYEIKIELRNSDVSDLPQVYEVGNRIKRLAKERGLQLTDFHINPTESACLCIKPEEKQNLPQGFNIADFFYNLLIPFFYAQSFFEKHNKWPWGQYGHGLWGFIEWYSKQENGKRENVLNFLKYSQKYQNNKEWQMFREWLASDHKVKGHHECICGKAVRIRNCHPGVLSGIWALKKDLIKFNISV